jgi:hypothetical protein
MKRIIPVTRYLIVLTALLLVSGCGEQRGKEKNNKTLSVSMDFEQGYIGKYEINGDTIRADIGQFADSIWFAFRIDGAEGRTLTIILNDILWSSATTRNHGHFRDSINCAAVTYDPEHLNWELTRPGSINGNLKQITFTHTFSKNTAWIYFSYTVTNSMLKAWMTGLKPKKYIEKEILCTTTGLNAGGPNGHCLPLPLYLLTITDKSVPEESKKVFWVITREDPWETSGTISVQGAVEFLLSQDPVAESARKNAVWKIIPLVNVDGVSSGFGGHPKNLNGGPQVYLTNTWGSEEDRFAEVVAIENKIKEWVLSGKRFDLGQRIHSYAYMVNNSHTTIEYNADSIAKIWSDRIVKAGSASIPYQGNPSPNRWTSWVRNTCNLPDVPLLSCEVGLIKNNAGTIHTIPEIKRIGEEMVRAYCEYFKFEK